MKPLIGLDLDGVLYRWTESAADTLHALRGVKVPDYGEDQYWDHIKEYLSKDDWNFLWNSREARRRCFGSGRPYADGVRAAWELEKLTRVVIMTHRPANVMDVTMAWLSAQGLRPHAVVHIADGDTKWEHEFAPHLKCFIDDNPDNALSISDELGIPTFVPARKYNRSVIPEADIVRFTDWETPLRWVRNNLNAEEGERG